MVSKMVLDFGFKLCSCFRNVRLLGFRLQDAPGVWPDKDGHASNRSAVMLHIFSRALYRQHASICRLRFLHTETRSPHQSPIKIDLSKP